MDQTDKNITQKQWDKIRINIVKRKFYNSRTQARFRGQEWHITMSEYMDIWLHNDLWAKSGHHVDDLVFSRQDMDKDWTIDNVHIITRGEMLANEVRHKNISKGKANSKKNKIVDNNKNI